MVAVGTLWVKGRWLSGACVSNLCSLMLIPWGRVAAWGVGARAGDRKAQHEKHTKQLPFFKNTDGIAFLTWFLECCAFLPWSIWERRMRARGVADAGQTPVQ